MTLSYVSSGIKRRFTVTLHDDGTMLLFTPAWIKSMLNIGFIILVRAFGLSLISLSFMS